MATVVLLKEDKMNIFFPIEQRLLMSSGFSDFTLITAGAEKMMMNEIKWRTGINSLVASLRWNLLIRNTHSHTHT